MGVTHQLVAVAVAVAVALGVSACGGEDPPVRLDPDGPDRTVVALVRCLEASGARRADGDEELEELVSASTEANTNHEGAHLMGRLIVDVFSPVREGVAPFGPSDYTVFVVRPLQSDKLESPAALGDGRGDVFVLRKPSPATFERASRCLES
jgi:hypothetical protein